MRLEFDFSEAEDVEVLRDKATNKILAKVTVATSKPGGSSTFILTRQYKNDLGEYEEESQTFQATEREALNNQVGELLKFLNLPADF